jgi:hypothetical protein
MSTKACRSGCAPGRGQFARVGAHVHRGLRGEGVGDDGGVRSSLVAARMRFIWSASGGPWPLWALVPGARRLASTRCTFPDAEPDVPETRNRNPQFLFSGTCLFPSHTPHAAPGPPRASLAGPGARRPGGTRGSECGLGKTGRRTSASWDIKQILMSDIKILNIGPGLLYVPLANRCAGRPGAKEQADMSKHTKPKTITVTASSCPTTGTGGRAAVRSRAVRGRRVGIRARGDKQRELFALCHHRLSVTGTEASDDRAAGRWSWPDTPCSATRPTAATNRDSRSRHGRVPA